MTEVERRWGVLDVRGDEGVLEEELAISSPPAMSLPQVAEPDQRSDGFATARLERVAARALEVGLRRVQVLAWRDFEDPEAGGSELHAHRMATAWARLRAPSSLTMAWMMFLMVLSE